MFKKILSTLDRIIEVGGNWAILWAGVCILLMGFLDTYGVFRRYVLNNPEFYSYEISVMLLTACCVLAVSGLQRYKRHLRVDFIANYLPNKAQIFLADILTPILALVYVGIIVWKGWNNTIYSFSIGETSQSAWEEPIWPVKLVIPVSMFWLCLVLIVQFIKGIGNLRKPDKPKV
jgi:TRAP-type mannitol/chloroaromatic compound transport system permease small subunit